MNQKLSNWASIAEIVSGVAVIITLVFLILGIRENTEITRASAYDRNIDSLNEVRGWIANNPDLATLYRAFLDDETVSIEEPRITQLNLMMNAIFGVFEKAYFAYEYGHIGQSEWNRFDKQICVQYSHILTGPPILDESLQRALTEEFLSYLQATCTPRER
jgi:hypothetical protein